jgi:hypothetical protein
MQFSHHSPEAEFVDFYSIHLELKREQPTQVITDAIFAKDVIQACRMTSLKRDDILDINYG